MMARQETQSRLSTEQLLVSQERFQTQAESAYRALAASVDDPSEQRELAHVVAEFDGLWALTKRNVTQALRAYGLMATSASRGAVRDVSQLKRR